MKQKYKILLGLVLVSLVLSGCVSQETLTSPITESEGFFTTFIVLPIAWLMYTTTELFGGYFFLGILATTLMFVLQVGRFMPKAMT